MKAYEVSVFTSSRMFTYLEVMVELRVVEQGTKVLRTYSTVAQEAKRRGEQKIFSILILSGFLFSALPLLL